MPSPTACTGKGNGPGSASSVAIACLGPSSKVLTPARSGGMSRRKTDRPTGERSGLAGTGGSKANTYSIDLTCSGAGCEAGPLEDPQVRPPEEVFWPDPLDRGGPKSPRWWRSLRCRAIPVASMGDADPSQPGRRAIDLAGSHGFVGWTSFENRVVRHQASREI